MKKLVGGLLFLFTLSFVACVDPDDVGDNYTTFTGEVIATYLDKNPDKFSEFTALLKRANAFVLLESYGKYTCFIPSNDAMRAYYSEIGKTAEQLTDDELKELVFYHLIDGERYNSKVYYTFDFSNGSIDTENMIGRYVYTSMPAGSPHWLINKAATIVTPNLEMGNGVVHVVDKVLRGNNDLLPDLIESDGRYSLFAQALDATGMRDSMLLIEDKSYVRPTTLPSGAATTNQKQYPEKKKYGYTALVVSDSIFKLRENITTLDELRAYAKRIYPEGASIADETNRANSLNRFISYHLLPAKIRSNRFNMTYGYVSEFDWFARKNDIVNDGKYKIEQYYIPMAPNTILSVQKGTIFNEVRNAFINNFSTSNDVIRILPEQADLDCQNGIAHGLNNILVYDQNVENTVFHQRLRMDFHTFLPEFINNDILAYEAKYNQWHRYIPDTYCKNLSFKEQRPDVYMTYYAPNVHPYLHGDELMMYGFFDLTVKIGPIPAGNYEVRLGYHVAPAERGVTQYYLDGEPCGIPIDQRLTATSAGIGWERDYYVANMEGGGGGGNPDDPYGYENDKGLRNRGYMKAPDSYTGSVYNTTPIFTARDAIYDLRKILIRVNWTETTTHELRLVQMRSGSSLLDYIEFMPIDLIDSEDTH